MAVDHFMLMGYSSLRSSNSTVDIRHPDGILCGALFSVGGVREGRQAEMIVRNQETGVHDGAPSDGLPTESVDAAGRGVEGGAGPSADFGLIIPPAGPIQVEPIDSEVVAWTRRWTGARMVERLRLGTALISVASFLWLDEEGRLRRLAPNPRAGELVRKSSRPGMRLAVPLVGIVCVTGGDTPAGGSRGLGVCQVSALRKAMGDWARPE